MMNTITFVKEYIKESYSELAHKVTWPSWSSLQSSTVLVLVASMMIALTVLIMDTISNKTLDLLVY